MTEISTDLRDADRIFMSRALQLAACGAGFVSPNPMVGAVIVAPDGRIIGEGWHRRFGGPHAEVNAVASVKESDRRLIPQSTIYVTLEPCSHYGKTPPCAKLLAECRFKRVVAAMVDPNPKVAGRGINMLVEAGIEVECGIMEDEARQLNRRFITAQREGRPWIQLKWCESADGFIGKTDSAGNPLPVRLSTPLTSVWMHRERTMADAIVVGSGTALSDRPRLTPRLWPGRSPLRVVADRRKRIDLDSLFPDGKAIRIGDDGESLPEAVARIGKDHSVGAIMVEGGATLMQALIDQNRFDEIRIERSPLRLGGGVPAPRLHPGQATEESAFIFPDRTSVRVLRR